MGLNHFAFAVDDRVELERFRALVATRGARFLYGGEIEETRTHHRFFFEDPDRIKVEVVSGR